MVDYNDGKWHGWSGGECPVHPEARVIVKWSCNGAETNEFFARAFSDHWHGEEICAFRVVKEPREFWIDINGYAHDNPQDARPISPMQRSIHVREVIE